MIPYVELSVVDVDHEFLKVDALLDFDHDLFPPYQCCCPQCSWLASWWFSVDYIYIYIYVVNLSIGVGMRDNVGFQVVARSGVRCSPKRPALPNHSPLFIIVLRFCMSSRVCLLLLEVG